jgi:membrane protease YdiL (CAAX protease family)
MEGQDTYGGDNPVNSFWMAGGELRAVWKLLAYAGTTFLAVPVLALVIQTVAGFLETGAQFWWMTPHLILLAAAVIATAVGALLIDGRPFLDYGLRGAAAARNLGLGLAAAAAMVSLVTAIGMSAGAVRLHVSAVSTGHAMKVLSGGLTVFLIVGFAEEMLLRGYPLRTLQRAAGPRFAVLITSVLFALMHVSNPHIGTAGYANIFLAGVWLGRACIVSESLWLPIGLHTGWNLFLGPVWGFPVSGVIEPSVLHADCEGAEWLTGGMFGPEEGLAVTAVLAAAIVLLYNKRIVRYLSGRSPGENPETIEKSTQRSRTDPETGNGGG